MIEGEWKHFATSRRSQESLLGLNSSFNNEQKVALIGGRNVLRHTSRLNVGFEHPGAKVVVNKKLWFWLEWLVWFRLVASFT